MKLIRIIFLTFLFIYPEFNFSQVKDSVDPVTEKKVKAMDKKLRGQWWLMRKICSAGAVYGRQETRMTTAVTDDTIRPLMRLEFQKKKMMLVHEFPYMKVRTAKEGSFSIELKNEGKTDATEKYFLVLSDELKKFIGIKGKAEISFRNKHLILTDENDCVFDWRAD